MNTANKARRTILNRILPFILIIGSVAAATYMPSEISVFSIIHVLPEIVVLTVFIITLIIYILRRYDFRLLLGMGVFLLLLSAGAFAWRGETNANQIAITAFYFLAIGVVGMLIDFMRSK